MLSPKVGCGRIPDLALLSETLPNSNWAVQGVRPMMLMLNETPSAVPDSNWEAEPQRAVMPREPWWGGATGVSVVDLIRTHWVSEHSGCGQE